jgi:DNA ligase-1
MTFRPLLAATVEDVRQVTYPKMVSPKLDGIRCIIHEGKAVSRNLKPIRNLHVQACLKGLPEGLDGELIVGAPTGELVFNRTTSGVMSGGGSPEFIFYVFDSVHMNANFNQRFISLHNIHHPHVKLVQHWHVYNEKSLLEVEKYCLETGYEGIMLRSPSGEYKFGHTVRSTHQDNKVGSERIGTIFAKDTKTGESLVISPGRMTQDERQRYYANPMLIINKIVKYKTFDYGKVNASRFCTFQGFRDVNDL